MVMRLPVVPLSRLTSPRSLRSPRSPTTLLTKTFQTRLGTLRTQKRKSSSRKTIYRLPSRQSRSAPSVSRLSRTPRWPRPHPHQRSQKRLQRKRRLFRPGVTQTGEGSSKSRTSRRRWSRSAHFACKRGGSTPAISSPMDSSLARCSALRSPWTRCASTSATSLGRAACTGHSRPFASSPWTARTSRSSLRAAPAAGRPSSSGLMLRSRLAARLARTCHRRPRRPSPGQSTLASTRPTSWMPLRRSTPNRSAKTIGRARLSAARPRRGSRRPASRRWSAVPPTPSLTR